MNIYLSTGVGTGKTLLSSFDAALFDAGIYNYNLLVLSSVIPTGGEIIQEKYQAKESEWGYRLYLVKAEMRSREAGKYIGAALGWYQLEDGRGVFVEHEEIGETKEAVESSLANDIKNSLTDLCRIRNIQVDEEKFQMKATIVQVKSGPTTVLVVAVYQTQAW